MARLPQPGTRVAPRTFGPSQIPDRSVAVEGQMAIGSALAGLGEEIHRQQVKDDKIRVDDAYTKLQARMLDMQKGEDGYEHVKAGDVVGNNKFHPENMSNYDMAVKDLDEGLNSDRQKQMFARRAAVARIGHEEGIINHTVKQKSIFNAQVYESGVATTIDVAAGNYDRPEIVEAQLLRIEKLTEAEAERLGLTGEPRKQALKSNKSAVHEQVIESMIDAQQYEMAQKYYDKNENKILGDKQGSIKESLRKSGLKEQSQEAANGYDQTNMTETEKIADARKKYSGDLETAVISEIKTREGENKQALDRSQEMGDERIWALVKNEVPGTTMQSRYRNIPESEKQAMDPRSRQSLENMLATGVPVKTDFGVWLDVKQKIADPDSNFKVSDLNRYVDKISEGDLQVMANKMLSPEKLNSARTDNRIMQEGMTAAGLDPKDGIKETGKQGEQARTYATRWDMEVKSLNLPKGQVASVEQLEAIKKRLSIEVIRERSMNPWSDKPWAMFGWDDETLVQDLEIQGIPTYMIDELAQEVIDSGGEPTVDNITKLYRAMTQ